MVIIAEADIGAEQAAILLDKHRAWAVDHDFCYAVVIEQWLDGAEPQNLRRNGLEEPQSVLPREDNALLFEDAIEQFFDGAAYLHCLREIHLGIHLSDERRLYLALQIEEIVFARRRRRRRRWILRGRRVACRWRAIRRRAAIHACGLIRECRMLTTANAASAASATSAASADATRKWPAQIVVIGAILPGAILVVAPLEDTHSPLLPHARLSSGRAPSAQRGESSQQVLVARTVKGLLAGNRCHAGAFVMLQHTLTASHATVTDSFASCVPVL